MLFHDVYSQQQFLFI